MDETLNIWPLIKAPLKFFAVFLLGAIIGAFGADNDTFRNCSKHNEAWLLNHGDIKCEIIK